jgi:threonine dehydrogenase-like Zn-dependent dehydrogenase
VRAAIFRNGDFVVDDMRDPTPSEGQVLVKSLCCGICGSDLHAAKHTSEFVDRSRRSGNRWALDPERDVVFGHEFCCEVVDHGPGTDKRL